MKELYLAIIEKFNKETVKEEYRNKGLTPIKYIDLYAGQEFEEEADAYLKPALFVKWEIDYTPDIPIATLTFKIVYENIRNTSNKSNSLEKAINFIDLINLTDKNLKSIETKHTSKLTLLNEALNIEPSVQDNHTLTYSCNYTEKSSTLENEYLKGTFNKTPFNSDIFLKLQ